MDKSKAGMLKIPSLLVNSVAGAGADTAEEESGANNITSIRREENSNVDGRGYDVGRTDRPRSLKSSSRSTSSMAKHSKDRVRVLRG